LEIEGVSRYALGSDLYGVEDVLKLSNALLDGQRGRLR